MSVPNREVVLLQGGQPSETERMLTLDAVLEGMSAKRLGAWVARYWNRVAKGSGATGCWLWTGATTSRGYGLVSLNGRLIRVHRLSLLISNGALPHEKYVLHKCDTPLCVRPSHLFCGTARDNSDDMIAKHRNAKRKLCEDDVRAIRSRHAAGESYRALALRFQVSRSTIWHVIARRSWHHVQDLRPAA